MIWVYDVLNPATDDEQFAAVTNVVSAAFYFAHPVLPAEIKYIETLLAPFWLDNQ